MNSNIFNKIIISLYLLLCIPFAHAQNNLGNPLDKLPQIKINKPTNPNINIEQKPSEIISENSQKLYIQTFNIQGVKSINFDKVSTIFLKLTNKNIEISDLLKAANEVTQLYKQEGYILSFAYVPQQDLTSSTIHVVIVEGYVKDIQLKGELQNNDTRITSILENLKLDKPLTQKTFNEITNVLALQPGIKVNLNIPAPTTTDGGTTVLAEITQKKYDVTLSLEAGNPEFQAIIAGTVNSLTSLGDQLTLLTLQPSGDKNKQFYGLNYLIPLDSKGTIGKINMTSYKEKPEDDILTNFGYNAQYNNKSQRLSISATKPLILENQRRWTFGGGLYINKEQQTYSPQEIYNTNPDLNITTRTTVLFAETNFITANEKQSRQIGLSVYKGFKNLGAYTENNINDINFTKIKIQANQNFTLPKNFELRLSGIYQYSPDILPSSEKISFGNRLFGAAYQPGEIAGDKGFGVSSEINYTIKPDFKYVKFIQPYILLEKAKVSNNKVAANPDNMSSVSLGTKMNNSTYYSLNFSVSKPLGRTPTDGHKTRYYLSYAYQF